MGKVAYEAYSLYSDGHSLVTGAKLPVWEDLRDDIKEAWKAAAEAVLSELTFMERGKR